MQFPLLRIVLGALTLATGLAGATPAGASVSPRQLVLRSIKATEAASAIRFKGVITERTKATAPVQRIALDVSGSTSGVGEGTIGIGKGIATVREVGGTIYFNANSAFWTTEGGQSASTIFAGRWVSTAATSATGQSLAEFLDSSTFLTVIFGKNLKSSIFTNAGSATVDGEAATVIGATYKKNDAHGKLYVASSGKPYVLKLAVASKDGAATLTFSNYNEVTHPIAPQGAIDLDTLS
jgi:hypothetical protein